MWPFKPTLRTYVFFPRTNGSIEKCLVVEQTETLYCLCRRVGLEIPNLQWNENPWVYKPDPRIIEVVSE